VLIVKVEGVKTVAVFFSAVLVSKHKKRKLLPGAAVDDVKRLEIYCKVMCLK